MTPVRLNIHGAVVCIHSTYIDVTVCRSINHVLGMFNWNGNDVISKNGKYYYVHKERIDLKWISNIDEAVDEVINTTNYLIKQL